MPSVSTDINGLGACICGPEYVSGMCMRASILQKLTDFVRHLDASYRLWQRPAMGTRICDVDTVRYIYISYIICIYIDNPVFIHSEWWLCRSSRTAAVRSTVHSIWYQMLSTIFFICCHVDVTPYVWWISWLDERARWLMNSHKIYIYIYYSWIDCGMCGYEYACSAQYSFVWSEACEQIGTIFKQLGIWYCLAWAVEYF